MKPSRPPAAALVNDAAHMLVASHLDCLGVTRYGNEFAAGWYAGRRSGAQFVLKHHCQDYGTAGRERVAAAVREWIRFFREHSKIK